jgi:hypothetical protein
LQQFFRIAMKKPEVAHPSKSFGENMLQDELHEVLAFEGSMANFAGLAFRILESHPAVLIGNDIFFTDYAPV